MAAILNVYHEQRLGIRHRNPESEKQINMASSSKPGSRIGRLRKEQESFRTGNDFRSDLLKNSRYSDRVSVSLQPSNVANLESLPSDKLAKAQLSLKTSQKA